MNFDSAIVSVVFYFFAIVACYIFTQFSGYLIHRLLHKPETGRIYVAHNNHHQILYPPENYLSEGFYLNPPWKDRSFWFYLPPALATASLIFLLFPLSLAIILSLELLFIAWLNDVLHNAVHVKGHWLERYHFFHRLRALHWWHHVDEKKNYGIFSWSADRLFKTFELPKEQPSYLKEPPSLK